MAPAPEPDASSVKIPGPALWTISGRIFEDAPWYCTCTWVLNFPASPYGTTALIWVAEAYVRAAGVSSNNTCTPPSVLVIDWPSEVTVSGTPAAGPILAP